MSLFKAIEENNLELFQELINKPDCNVNEMDETQTTALHIAICHNRFEIIKILLNHRANVNAVNKYGNTPLLYAVLFKNFFQPPKNCYQDFNVNHQVEYNKIIKELMYWNADVNIHCDNRHSMFDAAKQYKALDSMNYLFICLKYKELEMLWELNGHIYNNYIQWFPHELMDILFDLLNPENQYPGSIIKSLKCESVS